jgi:hypothetical protein
MMAEDTHTGSQDLTATSANYISTIDLGLVTRGLIDSEAIRVTGLEVAAARASSPIYASISRQATKIALEQGGYWGARLLAQLMLDEVLAAEPLRRTVMVAKVAPCDDGMVPAETVSWFKDQSAHVHSLLSDSDNLSDRIAEAVNSTNQELIIAVAREYGETYRRFLQWCLNVTTTRVRPAFAKIASDFAGMVRPTISEMGLLPSRLASAMDHLLLATDEDEEPPKLTCELQVNIPGSIAAGLQEVALSEMLADNARMVMSLDTYKTCPQCQYPAIVEAAQCVRCGRVYQTTAPRLV